MNFDAREELFECQNCGLKDSYDELPLARDMSMRFAIGDPYTDVECPECGALCYPVEEDQP